DLIYLAQTGSRPPQGRYALLDLGHTKSNLVIMEGSQVKMVRCFSWGGDRLTRAIEKAGQLDYEAAETFKHEKASIKEKGGDAIQNAIVGEFQDLGLQIRQTLFAFYESGESPIEALYLSGGTAKISGVEGFFSHLLNINVSSLDILEDSYTQLHDRERARLVVPRLLPLPFMGYFLIKEPRSTSVGANTPTRKILKN
ncbi:MAG: pilus assembly protein PilM, partial [bacterium]|nr:pilus assembly protein PilM [bacterium]